ncbi:MAG: MerR family transcriptional regulator [Spirochaetales bacterium]|nr:MerR family transcriptional regulator [Spirochaetales bacterium]
MYSIGEFSKINRITTKTLRHYDRIGLFKPAATDEWTGYRFYKPSQLSDIQRILELKSLGFTLAEIQDIHSGSVALAELLKHRKRVLNREIDEQKRNLARIDDILSRAEGERRMNESVVIKSLPEVIVASMRTIVPGYDTYFDIVPEMGDYMRSVGAVCREPAYCFTIYHDGEYRETDIDAEICEAVTSPCRDSDKVKFKTIQGWQETACLKHRGPYETLSHTYNALFSWINDNSWEPADNPRECYIDGIWNKETPADWLTEVQVPVKKAGKA